MGIPVYIFTGFLESGKTTLIKDTLCDPGFGTMEKTLLLLCEEGEVAFDDAFLVDHHVALVNVASEKDITSTFLKKCNDLIHPQRVMVEYNGTWSMTRFMDIAIPTEWVVVQTVSTVDAQTFQGYVRNMRSLLYEQLIYSDVIIFNRINTTTDMRYLRNNVLAMNRKAQLIYETIQGEIVTPFADVMPFDVNQDVLSIRDEDYGLWYMDTLQHPSIYEGKHVQLRGEIVTMHVEKRVDAFVFGRYAMVCCQEDTSLLGFLCYGKVLEKVQEGMWITLDARMRLVYDEECQENVFYLEVTSMQRIEPVKDKLVYFT